ncbi:prolyl 3-hydroxylase 1-like [Limulus polyphemus]|uniref:procollagen-proline 3-dioxygenase n=1 Tax=Limulus polyphemus TaxID=6850 RepID=A0ABM1B0V7_LIMPO|nr:prolyl 3-hydroxylase 1-like [Limulus polyphemus]
MSKVNANSSTSNNTSIGTRRVIIWLKYLNKWNIEVIMSFWVMSCVLLFFIFISSPVYSVSGSPKTELTYADYYEAGVEAYLDNRWKECINFLEKSLKEYSLHRSALVECRKSCRKKDFVLRSGVYHDRGTMFMAFYEEIIKNALCIMKCYHRSNSLYVRSVAVAKETEQNFENKMPYDYLQLCYFKEEHIEKAASAAYTYLLHNKDQEVMKNNLKYYLELPGMDVTKLNYLEAKEYQELYIKAGNKYSEGNYGAVVELMEQALIEYQKALEECRFLCEGAIESSPETELVLSIANFFTSSLRCKVDCPDKLSVIYGEKNEDFLPSHYHYLQFAYFHIGKVRKACEAVASYLLLMPEDPIMIENKVFYSKLNEVQEEWFAPRQETVNIYHEQERERSLLQFIENEFIFQDGDSFQNESRDEVQNAVENMQTDSNSTNTGSTGMKKEHHKRSAQEIQFWTESNKIQVILQEKDLNGTLRFAADGLLTNEQCEKLVILANEGAVNGDGYNGKQSPHTEFEMFEGLTVGRAAVLANNGELDVETVILLLNVSEKARRFVEMYFKLESSLYFAYTHLVCRRPVPDSPEKRKDLSHPVHADNCVLLTDGRCLKERPAYTWRDYSAIVYLNDDFDGGEFIFAKDKETVQAKIQPTCGRMVGFSAGVENLHGVEAVTRGRRCALGMWYTLDSKHKEGDRDFAEQVLHKLVVRTSEEENQGEKTKIHFDDDKKSPKNQQNNENEDNVFTSTNHLNPPPVTQERKQDKRRDQQIHEDL